MKYKPILVFICLLPTYSFAEEICLASLLENIRERHPLLQAVSEEQAFAEADLLSAQGAFDRSIKMNAKSYASGYYDGQYVDTFFEQPLETQGSRIIAGYRNGGGSYPTYEDELETLNQGEFRVGVDIPLLRDGAIDRRRTQIGKSELQKNIAQALIEQRRNDLLRLGTQSYIDWLAARERRKVYADLLNVAEIRNKQLIERVQHGDLPKFDQRDNERALFQRKTQLVSAERSLQQATFEFSLFYRDELGDPIRPEETIESRLIETAPIFQKSFEENFSTALSKRPEMARLKNLREQNALEKKLAENQILPKLDFNVEASQDAGEGSKSREQGEVKAGLKVEIPLQTRVQEGRSLFAQAKDRELIKAYSTTNSINKI
jgi:outer membrane protein, heavy metal efflux system